MTHRPGLLGGFALAAGLAAVGWLALRSGAPERLPGRDADSRRPGATETSPRGAKSAANGVAPAAHAAAATTPGTIHGVVEMGDPAMPDVARKVTLFREGGRVRDTMTDTSGAFAFDGVEPDVAHEVVVEAEGFGPERIPGVTLGAGERRDIGTLLLGPPGRIDVAVTDDRGAAIAGATVEAFRAPEGQLSDVIARLDAGASAVPVVGAATDAAGHATLAVAADGSWSIAVRAPGRAREAVAQIYLGRNVESHSRSVAFALPAAETLRGHVRDAAGRAVASAFVAARRRPPIDPGEHGARIESSALWQRTTADAEGRFAFDALPPGEIELVACPPGGAPSPVAEVSVPEIADVDLVLPRPATLSGRVTDDTGAPVPGVVVAVGVQGFGWEKRTFGRIATSDADGRWTLDHLPPGTAFDTDVVVPRPWSASRFDGSFRGALRDGEARTFDFTVRRGATITGRVTCDGAPVSGAEVEAITFAPGWDWVLGGGDARADADGRFRIEAVLPGPVAVFALAPGDDSYKARDAFIGAIKRDVKARERDVIEIAAGAAVQRDVAIVRWPNDDARFEENARAMPKGLRPLRVHGRITTADGLPLLRARVASYAGNFEPMHGYAMFARPVRPDGIYESSDALLEDVDVVTVWATDDRHGEVLQEKVDVPDGATDVTIDLVLPARHVVRGRVVADGVPVAGADVWRGGAIAARSRADGSFEIAMDAGKVDLVVTAKGFVRDENDDTYGIEVPVDHELTVLLRPAQTIAGRVVDAAGRPIAGVTVAPVDDHGDRVAPYGEEDGREDRLLPVTGDDGAFVLDGLHPGAFRLRAASAQGAAAPIGETTTDEIAAGTKDAQIVVKPGVRVAGRVTGPDGKPVFRAQIECTALDADGKRDTEHVRKSDVDVSGDFAFEGLPAGDYVVDVHPPYGAGLAPARRRVTGGPKDVTIALEAAGVISGVIVTPDGRPFIRCALELHRLDDAPKDEPTWPAKLETEWTQDDASFRILVPPRGRFRVTFSDYGGARERAILTGGDDVAAGTTDLRLVAVPGWRLGGWVRTPNGESLAGSDVEVRTPDGTVRRARTDADGHFEVGGIEEPVKTDVTATLDGYVPDRKQGVVAGSLAVRLFLKRGLTITGRLLDADGKPPKGLHVRALSPDEAGLDLWRAALDDRGRFEIRGLAEGEWVLDAIVPGCMTVTEKAPLGTHRAGTKDLELRLPK